MRMLSTWSTTRSDQFRNKAAPTSPAHAFARLPPRYAPRLPLHDRRGNARARGRAVAAASAAGETLRRRLAHRLHLSRRLARVAAADSGTNPVSDRRGD